MASAHNHIAVQSDASFLTKAMLQYRKIVFQSWICGLILALSGLFSVPVALSQTNDETSCTPVVVAIEGGADIGGRSIEQLAKKLVPNVHGYVISVDNHYLFDKTIFNWWLNGDKSIKIERDNILSDLAVGLIDLKLFIAKKVPVFDSEDADRLAKILADLGLWPIVLIGHSLGGASAHYIASRINVSLLLTLDAVSSPDDQPHPGGGAKWINVYAKNYLGMGDGWGEDWEYEPNADVNRHLKSTSFHDHYKVIWMFNRASDDVYSALNRCTPNPHAQHGLDEELYRKLCHANIEEVRCFEGRLSR